MFVTISHFFTLAIVQYLLWKPVTVMIHGWDIVVYYQHTRLFEPNQMVEVNRDNTKLLLVPIAALF